LPQDSPQVTTQGSGFFITADGYAVTNRHVVENSKTAEIKTDDQKTYPAKVIGADPVSDLALLKVEGRNDFPHVRLADKPPRVGDWILAIGNPFGLGGTVTAGIVSARERDLGTNAHDDMIQIDAPINRGHSGGPTFDLDGNVIGVNTMIVSPTGGSVGIAFAIPADTVRMVVDQLREKGAVTRGWLGIQIQPVTAEIADNLGFKSTKGALVTEPQPDSPAAKAGIKSGDIITSVNGDAVENPRALSKKVAAAAPSTPVKLGVFRHGNEESVQVTLGELPSKDPAAGAR
jgi:serine protease Do